VQLGAGAMPGPDQLRRLSATFTVTGDTRVISGEERAFLSEATVG
jgi:hypothetical protein